MRTLATKQPTHESAKQNQNAEKGRSRSVSPLSIGMPLLQRQCACGGGCSRCQEQALLQTNLKISEPGDKYEQEADRIAAQVMRMPEPSVQRQVEPEEEEEEMVQRKAIAQQDTSEVPSIVYEVLDSPGQLLNAETRTFMEPRFRGDFSQVRVHTDAKAAESARAINALAYTVGQNIVFGAEQYAPNTASGQRLLAHELAHVLQQKDNRELQRIQRWAVNNCTTPQQEYIDEAVTRAYSDLSIVLPMISERPVPDYVRNALWLAFRDDSNAIANIAKDNIQTLKNQITSTHFVCRDRESDTECSRSTLAYAPIGNPTGTVSICRPQFFADDMTIYDQSQTVIHEAAHLYLSMRDRGYFASHQNLCSETAHPPGTFAPGDRYSGTAGDNPVLRLENADSYGCFVHYLRYLPRPQMNATAAGYRGENLRIESEDIFFGIYTQTITPQLHPFSIAGIPDNSGFRFRWQIEANGRNYNPSSMSSGVDAGAFNEENRSIFVDNSLARLLWNNGIRQAMLVCEVELYRPFGDRFVPPIVRKEVAVTIQNGEPPFNL